MQRKTLFIIGIIVVVALAGGALYFGVFQKQLGVSQFDIADVEAMIESGDYASAKALLEARLAQEPNDAEAHFQLGLVLFNLSDLVQAREHFLKALELDPTRASSVHHNLGVLSFRIGDLTTAQQEFNTALELDPSDPDSHYQLGATYLVQATSSESQIDAALVDSALTEFNAALELAPGKAEPLVGVGNIYLLQNQYEPAIDALNQALVSSPDMREALFALGKAYMMAGDFDNAKATLEHFMETDPPSQWGEAAQAMLDQIPE